MEDHGAGIGDWTTLAPSPITFLSSFLDDDYSVSRSDFERPGDNKNEGLSLGIQERKISGDIIDRNAREGTLGVQLTEQSTVPDLGGSSRGGLADRIAARAGFNAPRLNTESIRSADLSLNADVRSPYLTIPPGLSPTTLLESPVFLSNMLAQPSPTTGKFSFVTNCNDRSFPLIPEAPDRSKDNFFEDINTSSFAFKPVVDSDCSFPDASNKSTPGSVSQSFLGAEVSVQSKYHLLSQTVEPEKIHTQNVNGVQFHPDFSRLSTETDAEDNAFLSSRAFESIAGNPEQSPPLDGRQDEETDTRVKGDSISAPISAPAEDGYNWRKYGQKQVKGSEYPRSYYKCTNLNCQVKKKVERSHEGYITEIIYKGSHNHAKPPPNRRSTLGASNPLDFHPDDPERVGNVAGERTPSPSVGPEYGNTVTSMQAQDGAQFEDGSSTFSNEDEDDRATHGSLSLCYDGEGDESESKRRKLEAYSCEMSGASRAIREPRVVVQTTSEVDILDDGYRWRKYGQKVVKGNPNPRSYYKCTSAGCAVRKHVERASNDLKSVITTYEGKHNHEVPAARNSSHHVNSAAVPNSATQPSIQNHLQRPEPSPLYTAMPNFERPMMLGSFGIPGRPSPGFPFGIGQLGLSNFPMARLGPGQGNLPVLPPLPYTVRDHQMHEMGFMMPKGETKVEPVSEPGLNLSDNSSAVYQQFINRLQLGPQM